MMRPVDCRRVLFALALPLVALFAAAAPARAQAQPADAASVAVPALPPAPGYPPDQPPVFAPGFAVVTGFAGAVPATASPAPPPGGEPADLLTIDLNGPSLRAVDARSLGAPPQGQVVPAGKPLTVRAGQIGQVFAVALDDAAPPNIYAAATSAYGLPIVTADRNGDGAPDRARRGEPGAVFMPGLFGGDTPAGPGTIWRIDGATGQVSIFANVTFDGAPNGGAALGGLAYDRASRLLYAADRESGVIHAFAPDGREVARFDHGTDGLSALGLPAVPHNPARRLDIASEAFDPGDPATWNYAIPLRRVFGLAAHRGRLYYAVAAGARIFSVGLAPDGAFAGDVRLEYAMPPSAVPGTEVSKIVFDDAGHMIVAERAPPSGAYDFGALTAEGAGRVMRLRGKPPGAGGTPFHWADAGEYAIGFPGEHRNGDGGVAIGMGYDATGFLNFGACGGTVWSTGSQLRITDNPALGERLAAGGPFPIDGLQGNAVTLVRPQNAPPLQSYFIDFDDTAEQAGTPGHMGDVAAWRACPGPLYPMVAELLFEEAFCPVGTYFGRNRCLPSPCRPGEFYRAGSCERPQCVPDRRDPLCCPPGTKWNPRTQRCDRPQPKRPDLTIKKEVIRCTTTACTFRLVVSNAGDGPYSGPIAVGDQVTPGTVDSITPPSADWQCAPAGGNIFACVNNGTTLQPGQTLVFEVSVTFPASAVRGPWRNCAAVSGDRSKETNWSNNKSCVDGGRRPTPDPDPEKPNLTVSKTAGSCKSTGVSSGALCTFTIRVTNSGAGTYTGDVGVHDGVQGGTIRSASAGWQCAIDNSGSTDGQMRCTRPNTTLPPGQSIELEVVVEWVAGARRLTNCTSLLPREAADACADIRRPEIEIAKTAPAMCARTGTGTYLCQYSVTVTNTSPTDYAGNFVVSEIPISGQIVGAVSDNGTCAPRTGRDWTCTLTGGIPGNTARTIKVTVEEPANATSSRNCVLYGIGQLNGAGPPGGVPDPSYVKGTNGPACAEVPLPGEQTRDPSGPSPSCPPGMVRTLRGGCCTPESIAAGTCGTQTTETCPPPNVQVGNRCCSPAQMRDGTCGPPPPSCRPPAFVVNGVCCTREAFVAGRCGTTQSCPAPLVLYNDRCCNLREIQTGACGPPPPAGIIVTDPIGCPPGTFRDANGRCVPRTGIITDPGGCGPNQFRGDDGRCHNKPTTPTCGSGFVWDGRRCVKQPGTDTTKPACGSGFVWDGRRCVKQPGAGTKPACGRGLVWDGSKCTRQPGTKPTKPKPKPTGPIKRPPSIGTQPGSGAFKGVKPPSTRTITPAPRNIRR